MYTYEDILKFAESRDVTSRPFKEVIQLYEQEVDEIIRDAYADMMIDYSKSFPQEWEA